MSSPWENDPVLYDWAQPFLEDPNHPEAAALRMNGQPGADVSAVEGEEQEIPDVVVASPENEEQQMAELSALSALKNGETVTDQETLDRLVEQGYVRKTKKRHWVKPKGNRYRRKLVKQLDRELIEALRMAHSV